MIPGMIMKAGKETLGSLGELMEILSDLKDKNIKSLTEYTKRTLITSRAYIEDEIASEDIVPKILKLTNQMYSGFVMVALGMNNLFVGGKTVREMFTPVSTEAFCNFLDIINNEFGDKVTIRPATEGNEGDAKKEDDKKDDKGTKGVTVSEKEMKFNAAQLFSGRLLEMQVPSDSGKPVTIYFYVQILPVIVPRKTMVEFISNNTSPSISLRWAMWRAGEISFWKDLVFECDRVAKRRKALKVDKDGILREIEDNKSSSFIKSLSNFFNGNKATRRHNDANAIVIVTKRSLDEACKDIGVSMKNYSQRQDLMNGIMAAILVAYDPNFGTVDLYMNGINGRGEYNAKTIESATKGDKDALDIKELLQLIAAGSMPRF